MMTDEKKDVLQLLNKIQDAKNNVGALMVNVKKAKFYEKVMDALIAIELRIVKEEEVNNGRV